MLWMTNDDNGPLIDDLSMYDCKLYRYVTLLGGKHSYHVTMCFLNLLKDPQCSVDSPVVNSRNSLYQWLYDHNDRT